jgi:hypothetical protein
MAIINHILSGAARSARSWKWILVSWIMTLIVVALVIIPFRSGFETMLGSSMITERLRDGINLEALTNVGTGFSLLVKFLTSGILMLIITGFLMNLFFSGGFFDVLRRKQGENQSRGFFSASSSNFWSFLIITLGVRLIINLLSFLMIGLPLIILASDGSGSRVLKIIIISGAIFCLILPVLLLVSDYARAWQAASAKKDAIRALGKGFSYTFRYFFSSWLMMFLIVALQVLFTISAFSVIIRMKPDSGSGIFLMFLLSQLMFLIKIWLRTWRYGIITSKFEAHS